MNMIKCIVCDLDGTLINQEDKIEKETFQKLKYYMNRGIDFIIATGRDMNMVIDLLNTYQLECDLILNNGTQYKNKQRTINEIHPMNNEAFINIAQTLHQYGYLLAIHTDQGKFSLVNQDEFWDYHIKFLFKSFHCCSKEEFPQKTFTTREGYLRDFHYAHSPYEMIEKGVQVLKIDARHLDTDSIQGVKDKLNIPSLEISSSYDDNIEITTNAFNKGSMLEKVIKEKGYQYDEVAVFGDGLNDVSMLEKFVYSFVPSQADQYAKKAATYQLHFTSEEGAVKEGIDILEKLNLL